MSEWKHRLTNRNIVARTAICAICGPVTIKKKQKSWRCRKAVKAENKKYPGAIKRTLTRLPAFNLKKRPYILYRGSICTRCHFVPESLRQLDVHHIDGDHQNNDPTNLTTLCANCHRLVHS